MSEKYKYIVNYGVDLSHLFESCTCSTLKCAIALCEMNFAEGDAFAMCRIAAGSSRSEKLWNSDDQKQLDADRKRGDYMRKHNRVPAKNKECRYSLFNGESVTTRKERMSWMYPAPTY